MLRGEKIEGREERGEDKWLEEIGTEWPSRNLAGRMMRHTNRQSQTVRASVAPLADSLVHKTLNSFILVEKMRAHPCHSKFLFMFTNDRAFEMML